MQALLLLALAAGAAAVWSRTKTKSPSPAVRAAIEQAARAHGVPIPVALAFAEVESGFNPAAEGDREWPTRKPQLYQQLVVSKGGPYASQPALWHSYGLFQLLSPYHAKQGEDPRTLLNPAVNADRGCKYIARLLKRAGGDPEAARLYYVGCGFDGSHCTLADAQKVRAKFRAALQRWQAA